MSSSAGSGIGFFGAWQVLYLTLAQGIDAPWNKVQTWPYWAWLNAESVAFPTILGLTIGVIILVVAGIIWVLNEAFG